MSNIPTNKDKLNDIDLSALFAADNTEPPADLDKLVLENAHQSQHNSIPPATETFLDKYAPLFGTAAVLMIAIALTPLTMQQPESNLAHEAASAPTVVTQIPDSTNSANDTADATASFAADDTTTVNANIDSTDADGGSSLLAADNEESKSDLAVMPEQPTPPALKDQSVTAVASSNAATNDATKLQESRKIQARQEIKTAASNVAELVKPTMTPEPKRNDAITAEVAAVASQKSTIDAPTQAQKDTANKLGALALGTNNVDDQVVQSNAKPEISIVEIEQTPLVPNAFTGDTATRLAQEPAEQNNIDAEAPTAKDRASGVLAAAPVAELTPQRVRSEKYRSSALLWVIEIKHLYRENKIELAVEELTEFREQFPDSSNERLLPKALLDLMLK